MMTQNVVSREQWLEARRALLAKEKELTRLGDEMSRARRELPWVKVEKGYVFETASGPRSLSELFAGRRQLIVYHFMLAPGWAQGCVGCSFVADHLDGPLVHLENHDVSLVMVSRAPLAEIQQFQARRGWKTPWVSSHDTTFNYDYHVSATQYELARGRMEYNFETTEIDSSEQPGISVFIKDDDGSVHHTYSTYARGVETVLGAYRLLDLTPLGRNETSTMDWVRHHDRYAGQPKASCCCHGAESHG